MKIDTAEIELKAKDVDKIKENIFLKEIVRCKDCKNYEHIVTAVDNEGNVTKECDFCNHWKRIIDVSDFCSYGEVKEQEHE